MVMWIGEVVVVDEQVDGRRNSVVCVETGITFWRMSESRRETSVPTRQSDATLSITAAPYLDTSLSFGTNYAGCICTLFATFQVKLLFKFVR